MQIVFNTSKKIADSDIFGNAIIGVILLAGIIVGIQTYPEMEAQFGSVLNVLDSIILWIFVFEVVVKILAEGKQPWNYFTDPWNVFDFIIVAVCFLPFDSSFVAVLRLARILRVFKLVTSLPKLQMIVGALLKSIPSMGYVGLLLVLLFYIYGAMATFIFSENDPVHFGNLQMSMLSLFRVITLEDWTDIMYINMYGCDHPIWGYDAAAGCTKPNGLGLAACLFFVSFVLIGTMIVLNLFIGVIMTGMDEMKAESDKEEKLKRQAKGEASLTDELHLITEKIDTLKEEMDLILYKLGKEEESD